MGENETSRPVDSHTTQRPEQAPRDSEGDGPEDGNQRRPIRIAATSPVTDGYRSLAVGSVLIIGSVLLVPLFAYLGYCATVARAAGERGRDRAAFEDWWNLVLDGGYVWFALIYSGFGYVLTIGLLANINASIGGVAAILLWYFCPAFAFVYAKTGSKRATFASLLPVTTALTDAYIRAIVFTILIALAWYLGVVLSAVTIVGPIVLSAYVGIVVADYWGRTVEVERTAPDWMNLTLNEDREIGRSLLSRIGSGVTTLNRGIYSVAGGLAIRAKTIRDRSDDSRTDQRTERSESAKAESDPDRTRTPDPEPTDRSEIGDEALQFSRLEQSGEFDSVVRYQGRLAKTDESVTAYVLETDEDRSRFVRIVQRWASLGSHPHIANVIDYGETPQPWVVVERLASSPLEEIRDDLSQEERVEVITDIGEGVRSAHMYNVRHGLLDPSCIRVRRQSDEITGVVSDWGLEVAFRSADTASGIDPYKPPEFRDSESNQSMSKQGDMYRIGVLAFSLLAETEPTERDRSETDLEGLRPEPDSACLNAHYPSIERATATDPDARFTSPYHFSQALVKER